MKNDSYPRDALRDRLADLGIQREAHESRALAGMLPVRSNGALLGDFDPDAIAEALIYLIEKEIVRLPCRVDGLVDLDWGAHYCQFYRSCDDLLEFLAPYFRRGLEDGEYCLWLSAQPATSEALQASLAETVPDFESHASAMEFGVRDEWYLDLAGARQDTEVLLASWKEKAHAAIRAGYRGLRCAADTRDLDRKHRNGFAEYECEVNAALGELSIKAVCAYPLLDCTPRHLSDLRDTHQDIFVKGDMWWHRIAATDVNEAHAVLMALQGGRQ